MRVVIVGGGAAAVSAVEAIRQQDTRSSIVVITAEDARPYTPCFLGRYVTGRIGFDELALRPTGHLEQLGVEVRAGRTAVRIDAASHEIVLDDGEHIAYDALLLAYGARQIVPPVPGILGPGTVGFRTLTDADRLRERLGEARNALVLGSGFVALEAAEALAEAGLDVGVLVRTGRVLRRLFDEQVAARVEEHMTSRGVRFLKNTSLTGIRRDGTGGVLTSVVLDGDVEVPCDLLVLAVGAAPDTALARTAGIDVAEGILTDASMRTSVPGIWAAGDVSEPEIAGVRKVNLIHPHAILTGRIAGLSITGSDRPMSSHFRDMNVLTVFGKSFLSIGEIGQGDALVRHEGSDDLLKVFVDDGVVTGVQIIGNVARGGIYAALLGRRLPEGVGARLLAPDFNFGDIETWPFAS